MATFMPRYQTCDITHYGLDAICFSVFAYILFEF